MIVLGIESSCDESSVGIVRDGRQILALSTFSQVVLHEKKGGVIPEVAAHSHVEQILPQVSLSLQQAGLSLEQIDLFAATMGPGLLGCLLIGMNMAKAFSLSLNRPFIGVNHLHAHLYAAQLSTLEPISFPALGCILSGGHTLLLYMDSMHRYHCLGQTVDDAVGEAFDKVALLLGGSYPGGALIEKWAREGDSEKYAFRAGRVAGAPLSFSYSGLKTQVLYTLKGNNAHRSSENLLAEGEFVHLAASFQRAIFSDLVEKIYLAQRKFPCENLLFGGGVCRNRALREYLKEHFSNCTLHWPTEELCLDNGAMIAGLAYEKKREGGKKETLLLEPSPQLFL